MCFGSLVFVGGVQIGIHDGLCFSDLVLEVGSDLGNTCWPWHSDLGVLFDKSKLSMTFYVSSMTT